jgi:phospholipase C
MKQWAAAYLRVVATVLGASGLLCSCAGGTAVAPPAVSVQGDAHRARAAALSSPIRHIVLVIQENRSVDNLFNGLPGADTQSYGYDSHGNKVVLQAEPLNTTWDPSHTHAAFVTEYDKGKLNGWDLDRYICQGTPCTPPPELEFGYVPQSDVQPYWTMAQAYAFADEMFQTNQGPSFPAHMYLADGNSATDNTNTLYAMNNSQTSTGATAKAGCDAPAGSYVVLINPLTNNHSQTAYPCFDHQTLWDLLDAAGVSWKYYQPTLGPGLWYTPDAIKHIRYGADYANVSTPQTNILSDITNGTLPEMSWVIPTAAESDHAGETDGSGPDWVAQVVNAIGESPYWNNTVVFVVWDDWGGWFDHVAPHMYNHYELGFRVPLIAISPYAKAGYVSHTTHEFGSILKFSEETFGLGSLGTTDARADDLSDMFDYSQTPLTFIPISAPTPPASAVRDTRIPDDDD